MPRRKLHRLLVAAIAAPLLSAACARSAPNTAAVAAPLISPSAKAEFTRFADSLLLAPKFRNAHWGVLVVDPATGDTVYSRNAGKLFMPASNMKIITGATALVQLGPDYRYRTLFATGRAAPGAPRWTRGDSVLTGDLVVVGRGDPTISDHMRGNAMLGLLAIADSLAALGVRRIDGRVVAAGDAFPGPVLGFGWSWDDLDFPYSAGVDELLFNEGFATVTVRGGAAAGDPASARTTPTLTYPRVDLQVRTIARGENGPAGRVRIDSDRAPGFVRLTGTVVAGDSVRVNVAHRDPSGAYLAALREALRIRGIVLAQHSDSVPTRSYAAAELDSLFVVSSLTLRDILPAVEKPSQNQIAEVLLRTLGLEFGGAGSPDSGRRVVERQLRAWGADTTGFIIRDGSGLSRHNYLSPETIVRVLAAMQREPNFSVFYDALPIAGVDGTIARRMTGTPAEGNLRAKTGYIDRARALSGYVNTADGRRLIFSMICNNWSVQTSEVEEVQDLLSVALASMRLRAGVAEGTP